MSTLTSTETAQIAAANASGRPTVVLVHGLWVLASSWDPWRAYFESKGLATVAPSWPDDPATVAEARRDPSVLAGKGVAQVTDHMSEVIRALDHRPVIVGHSFGGLITQKLAGTGLASAAVVIDPAPFKGVLPLPISTLRSSLPVLGNPRTGRRRSRSPTPSSATAGPTPSARPRREACTSPITSRPPGRPLFQAALANYTSRSEAAVDTRAANRGPMKFISGGADHTVPWAITNASYKKQRHNAAVTEIEEVPERGHSLTIDSGWEQVADIAHAFIARNTLALPWKDNS